MHPHIVIHACIVCEHLFTVCGRIAHYHHTCYKRDIGRQTDGHVHTSLFWYHLKEADTAWSCAAYHLVTICCLVVDNFI